MPPNMTSNCTGVLDENDAETYDGGLVQDITQLKKAEKRKVQIVWRNVIMFSYIHLAAVYGLWLFLTSAMYYTRFYGK